MEDLKGRGRIVRASEGEGSAERGTEKGKELSRDGVVG